MKITFFTRYFFSISLFWLVACSPFVQGASEPKLLVHTPLLAPTVTFDAQTKAWLNSQSRIRVAFWGGAYPPLHIGYELNYFEGVTADVLGLLQQTLGIPIEMHRFADRDGALRAMARGEVDVLALNELTEPNSSVFKSSVPYLLNNKVDVRRVNDSSKTSADHGVERLAYIETTGSRIKRIKQYAPRSILVPYTNHLNALTGLAYDQVDVFRTNSITAEFILSSFYRNHLYIVDDLATKSVADINFAVSTQTPLLLKAINQSLTAIPVADMLRITSNWGLSDNFVIARKSLALTPEQKRWIAEHPKLKVIVADAYAPLTFFDNNNRLSGLSADMLKLIERSTGLEFEVVRSDGISDMVSKLQDHKVDLIAALSIGDFRLEPDQYTRPYLISSFVVVTRLAESGIRSLNELNGFRLALPWGSPLSSSVKNEYPNITEVVVKNATQGLEMLVAGDVDGAVHTQFGASYFINQHFQSDLHIASVIGSRPARIAMAVGPDEQVLKSIIDAALLDTRPDEFRVMTDRWNVHEPPAVASSWSTYNDVVYKVILGAILFVLVFLIWNHYLRVQNQKRQKAEQALEDQLQFTRTLIDGAPVALYVRDTQGRLAQCNQAYLNFFKTSRDLVIGKTLIESQVFDADINVRFHEAHLEALKYGQSAFADIDVEVQNQQYRIYHWMLPFQNFSGKYIGVIGGWLDITEREHLLEQLRLANEAAMDASRSKSVFLASMSHEIRTPVSALVGLIELLRLKGGDAEIDENLEVAHQSAQSLLSLIGDVLDLSKIEAGEMKPIPRPTNLVEMAQSIYRLFESNAHKRNLEYSLVTEIQHEGIMIDALMLNQIVSNLLSNSIKFTDQGSVQLLLRELPGEPLPGRGRFAIQVSDTGRGLSERQRLEIFEPFVQADPQAHRAVGTGLGLSICASLSKLLNIQLSVDSQPGLGSRFTLVFEAELVEVVQRSVSLTVEPQSSHKLRVLVVEDHAPNRLLLCRQLEYLGHEAFPCDDGEAAFAQWKRAEPPFDLTITDCNMPRMDGYELSRSIRGVEQERAIRMHPIFGLTANAQVEITERCLDAGMSRCLFKPVGIDTLAPLIAEVEQNCKRLALAGAANSELDKIKLLSPESYAPLVNEMVLSHRAEGHELERFAREGNRGGLARTAHKLRGGAQLVADSALIEACRALEQLCTDEADSCSYDAQVEQVLACLQALEVRLLKGLPS